MLLCHLNFATNEPAKTCKLPRTDTSLQYSFVLLLWFVAVFEKVSHRLKYSRILLPTINSPAREENTVSRLSLFSYCLHYTSSVMLLRLEKSCMQAQHVIPGV
ncbi:hypothetical protein KC19_2G295000 [Ceratodon purpureus]|uniref:Uncharacterized protein n=1 Tax=Ceratodon purpureus TaxID=3225 RepID=A0A8T0J262_CERPU|nr:hypothetical protein KC19_2G295000 [Ceratodon purpureus]